MSDPIQSLPAYNTPFAGPDENGHPSKEPTKPGVTATRHDSRAMTKILVKFSENMQKMKQGKIRPNRETKKGSGVKGTAPVKASNIKFH